MKEMIEKLLAVFPAYVRQLIGLFSGPKRFISNLDFDTPGALQDALIFIAVSYGIASVANLPLLPEKQNREEFFGLLAVVLALDLLLTIAITVLSWKIVGGKFDLKRLTIAISYFSGVGALLGAVPAWIGLGLAGLIDPVHLREMKQQASGAALLDPIEVVKSPAFLIMVGMICVGLFGGYIWNFCVWGAYRAMAGLSKARSGFAFGIFAILNLVLVMADVLMTSSITGVHKSSLPKELLGEWQTQSETESDGGHAIHKAGYGFFADDSYYVIDDVRTLKGNCAEDVVVREEGIASGDGASLVLNPRNRTQIKSDSCTGKKVTIKLTADSEMYQYRIDEQASGWRLCLSNRFGETCYAPEPR